MPRVPCCVTPCGDEDSDAWPVPALDHRGWEQDGHQAQGFGPEPLSAIGHQTLGIKLGQLQLVKSLQGLPGTQPGRVGETGHPGSFHPLP